MNERLLGRQGLSSSAIGYRTARISVSHGPTDERDHIDAIHRAYDLGITHIDTADRYDWGENERIVGRAVKSFRDDIAIATKFGFTAPDLGFDCRPVHIRQALESSLRNIGVDYIDIFYQYGVDPNVPIEEVAGTVKELIDAGKVKYFGLSQADEYAVRRAHVVQPVSVVQAEYSVFQQDVACLFPTLRELGIGFVAHQPFEPAFLQSDIRRIADLGEVYDLSRYSRKLKSQRSIVRLAGLAASLGTTPMQLALLWVLQQGDDIVPVLGSRTEGHLQEIVGAADLDLSPNELKQVGRLIRSAGDQRISRRQYCLPGMKNAWEHDADPGNARASQRSRWPRCRP